MFSWATMTLPWSELRDAMMCARVPDLTRAPGKVLGDFLRYNLWRGARLMLAGNIRTVSRQRLARLRRRGGAALVVLLNDGAGNLAPQPAVPAPGAGAAVFADFNSDGNLDVAVANTGGSSVGLYRGDGSGTFVASGCYPTAKRRYRWLHLTSITMEQRI